MVILLISVLLRNEEENLKENISSLDYIKKRNIAIYQ